MTCERAVQFPASAEPSVARNNHFVSGCVLRRAMVSPPTWNSVTGSVAKSTVKLPQGPVPSAEFGILALLVLLCFVFFLFIFGLLWLLFGGHVFRQVAREAAFFVE